MRGVNIIVQAVLIFAIALAAIIFVVPWTMGIIEESSESSEASIILGELRVCNSKITDTARTGSGNTCLFSVETGDLDVQEDGIYYTLTSTTQRICDQHIWMIIDDINHISQSCDIFGERITLQLKWSWPNQLNIGGSNIGGSVGNSTIIIGDVNFTTISVYVQFESIPGQKGDTLDIIRESISEDDVQLKATLR